MLAAQQSATISRAQSEQWLFMSIHSSDEGGKGMRAHCYGFLSHYIRQKIGFGAFI